MALNITSALTTRPPEHTVNQMPNRTCLSFAASIKNKKKKTGNERKVKANPYHFGRFWPFFQLFKNGSKTKANPFRIIFSHSQSGFMPF